MTNPLFEMLLGAHAESTAPLLHLPDGKVVTYAEMARRAAKVAGLLHARGLTKGDRLAMQTAKSPEALALYLGCVRAGVILLPLNTAYTPDEMTYFIGDASPRMVVLDPASERALAEAARLSGAEVLTLDAQGAGSLTKALVGTTDAPEPAPCVTDDLACLLYTSGTTGRSKGAMLTHGNLVSNARTLVESWHFTADDVLLHVLPIFHAHGLFVACNVVMTSGASMIWQPAFNAGDVIAALPNASVMMGVPTFYTRLLATPEFTRDVSGHMRLFTSGSAPLLTETHVSFRARTGLAILERYGMTETGMNTSNPYDGDRRAGTVGAPLPGIELRVTDPETAAPLPQGNTGMIEVRGPNVFEGYWQMPEKTAEELRPDGWFVTGDLGVVDDDGYVTIVGREKDLIISGGYNIYPREVESLLDDQPGVAESAVIGLPHPDFGEGVVAVLVPQDGASPDLNAIAVTVKAQLANYKRPKHYILRDALPRNTMGKVQKNALRAEHAALFSAPSGDVLKAGE